VQLLRGEQKNGEPSDSLHDDHADEKESGPVEKDLDHDGLFWSLHKKYGLESFFICWAPVVAANQKRPCTCLDDLIEDTIDEYETKVEEEDLQHVRKLTTVL